MKHFLKDKKADIYEIQINTDMRGIKDTSLSLKIPGVWCYTKQVNADIYFKNRAEGIKEERLFVFTPRKPPVISVGDVIKYKNFYYRITRADDSDRNNIFCYVEKFKF